MSLEYPFLLQVAAVFNGCEWLVLGDLAELGKREVAEPSAKALQEPAAQAALDEQARRRVRGARWLARLVSHIEAPVVTPASVEARRVEADPGRSNVGCNR